MTNARAQSKVDWVLFEQRTNWIKHIFRFLRELTMLETPQSWGIRRDKPMRCKNSIARTMRLRQSSDARISCETCTRLARASLARDMHASMNGPNTRPSCAAQIGVCMHPTQASAMNHILQLLWTYQKMCLHLTTTHL